jgi:hypothetical protein
MEVNLKKGKISYMKPVIKPRHQYHQLMAYKIFMSRKSSPKPYATAEESLGIIKGMHELTRGLKQIVYLAGWQYEGHDSKYPAWFEANRKIKRNCDKDARESLLWLIEAAKKFNAIVSVHINMDDAYMNSPLWKEYVKKDLIIKNQDGALRKGDIWDGELCYWISKTREWECGLGRKRIDRLLEYLPLADAGTVHIDAFRPHPSGYHGVSVEMEIETAKNIYRYWDSKGVDVTNEYLSYHELVGYVPMVWALNLDEQSRLRYSPSLLCGGHEGWNMRTGQVHKLPAWAGACFVPEAGTRYEEAWGRSCSCDLYVHSDDKSHCVESMTQPFCEKTLPWYFLNRHQALELRQTADEYSVHFEGGIVSSVRVSDRHHSIRQKGNLLVDGHDLFIPALWRKGEIIAWSRNGAKRKWKLPSNWKNCKQLSLRNLDTKGLGRKRRLPVKNGEIELDMPPMTALSISCLCNIF